MTGAYHTQHFPAVDSCPGDTSWAQAQQACEGGSAPNVAGKSSANGVYSWENHQYRIKYGNITQFWWFSHKASLIVDDWYVILPLNPPYYRLLIDDFPSYKPTFINMGFPC